MREIETVKAAKTDPASKSLSPVVQRPKKGGALADLLDRHTRVGTLWKPEEGRIRCVACGHRCLIAPGRRGICKVRFNDGGQLRVPFGYTAGVACDPVEKKPFFHVHPGSDALTFGMLGCDFHCSYCQNWVTSQALRDDAASAPFQAVTPEELVRAARRNGARLVASSYNEPLITAEWAVAVFQPAKAQGLLCAFVSNGNATPEALDFLQPWIVAYKVDLKGFDDRRYRTLGGTLDHVTDTIKMVHQRGIWLEVVTLIVSNTLSTATPWTTYVLLTASRTIACTTQAATCSLSWKPSGAPATRARPTNNSATTSPRSPRNSPLRLLGSWPTAMTSGSGRSALPIRALSLGFSPPPT